MTGRTAGNWGRWGTDDQRGAANLVTRDVTLDAVSRVRTGRVHNLALPIAADMASVGSRPRPQHFMTLDGADYQAGVRFAGDQYQAADDHLSMPCHGGTHVDGLAHVWYDHELYNGHPESAVRSYGATRCGIERLGGVVTVGLLLDVARARGVDVLPGGYQISAADLEMCSAAAAVRGGAAVLVRTGWVAALAQGTVAEPAVSPGIGLDAARWLAERDVAFVGADNPAVEATTGPHRYGTGTRVPECHKLLIRDHGTYLIEMLWLDDLAADAAEDFLFVVAPLPIVGGTASPLNPLAVT